MCDATTTVLSRASRPDGAGLGFVSLPRRHADAGGLLGALDCKSATPTCR